MCKPNGSVLLYPFHMTLYQVCWLDLICTWDHRTVICRLQTRWKFTTLYSLQLVAFVWEKCQPPVIQIDMQVVPTEYRYLSKKVVPTNQFSVTEYFVPIRPTDRSWPGNTIRTLLHLFSSGLIRFLLQPFTSCMISRQSQSPSKKKDATSYIS